MDIATIIGIVGCAGAVVYGIVSGDQGFAALENFWDFSSFLIVIVGCLMCMMTMSENIGDFVDQNPQIAAKLIQGWLRGEEGDSSGSRNAHRGARK